MVFDFQFQCCDFLFGGVNKPLYSRTVGTLKWSNILQQQQEMLHLFLTGFYLQKPVKSFQIILPSDIIIALRFVFVSAQSRAK